MQATRNAIMSRTLGIYHIFQSHGHPSAQPWLYYTIVLFYLLRFTIEYAILIYDSDSGVDSSVALLVQ